MGFIKDFLTRYFESKSKSNIKKRGRKKVNFSELDPEVEVSYHPELLYYMNLPFAEYVDYVEL